MLFVAGLLLADAAPCRSQAGGKGRVELHLPA